LKPENVTISWKIVEHRNAIIVVHSLTVVQKFVQIIREKNQLKLLLFLFAKMVEIFSIANAAPNVWNTRCIIEEQGLGLI
jgi:hypothetical protein